MLINYLECKALPFGMVIMIPPSALEPHVWQCQSANHVSQAFN